MSFLFAGILIRNSFVSSLADITKSSNNSIVDDICSVDIIGPISSDDDSQKKHGVAEAAAETHLVAAVTQ